MTLSWNMFRPLLLLLWCINLLSCQECNISEDDLDMDAAMHGLRSGMRSSLLLHKLHIYSLEISL